MSSTNYNIEIADLDTLTKAKIISINKTRDKIESRNILKWYRNNQYALNIGFYKIVDLVNNNNLLFRIPEKKLFKKYLKMIYFNKLRREII